MQNGGDQRVGVEAKIRQDVGDRDGVRDVRLPRNALLAMMFFRAEFVGLADPLDLRGREIGFELI
jgi:hypothetical protein